MTDFHILTSLQRATDYKTGGNLNSKQTSRSLQAMHMIMNHEKDDHSAPQNEQGGGGKRCSGNGS